MPQYIIPTIFTAVNGIGATVVQMNNQLNGLALHAERANVAINSMTPSFGGVGRAVKSMAPYLIAGGVIAAAALSGKALVDYQTEISNLSAVTGATGEQLEKFKGQIEGVAKDKQIKRSMVEVAQAFTAVDNNLPELHQFPDQLAEVTKQVIILAKAGRMELQPAAEAMTMTMNQFGASSKDAAHMIDVMAAGAVYGSSRIAETAEALQKFGAVAKNTLGITFEESVALVELGSKFEKGAEGGTRLRNILLQLAIIKLHPEMMQQMTEMGVNMERVTSPLVRLSDKLKELSKIEGNKELMALFGEKRNVSMLSGLFAQVDRLPKITQGLKAVGLAAQMAEKNTDNIAGSVQQLVAAWDNMIITSGQANAGLAIVNSTIKFATDHLEALISTVVIVGESFLLVKGVIFTTTKAVAAFNFVVGLCAAGNTALEMSAYKSAAGMTGLAIATGIAEIGMGNFLGIIGLASAAIAVYANHVSIANKKEAFLNGQIKVTKDGFEQVVAPINNATIALKEYNLAVEEYDKKQNEIAFEKYMWKNHPRQMATDKMFAHPLDNIFGGPKLMSDTTEAGKAPDRKEYPDIDTGVKTAADTTKAPGITFNNDNSNMINLLKQIADNTAMQAGGKKGTAVTRTA